MMSPSQAVSDAFGCVLFRKDALIWSEYTVCAIYSLWIG